MDGGQTAGGGGAGPAPFLLKTYEMVDDSSTDEIVSWSLTNTSFVVWNPPEFSRLLLPTYFKHNNFSSFIRQLNTYGFRKIDPERWEFANEEFVKDQKHLLKNIHRRKPIHSHSQPHGSFGDAERMALEDEIDRLSREKTTLQNDLWRFQQQQSGTKLQLEELERRVHEMELRQQRMISFLAKAAQNPSFVDNLIQMAGASMDFSAINKKRRLPKVDYGQEVVENVFLDNHSSSSRPELGHIFHLDFSSKLKLELSPAVSDSNLISASVQSSNEDGGSPQGRPSEGSAPKDAYMRAEGFSFAPETLELSDTGTSFLLKKNVPLSRQTRNEGPELHDLRCCSTSAEEEGDDLMSCHLNLTLASSPLQVDNIHYSAKSSNPLGVQDVDTSAELNGREIDHRGVIKNRAFTSIDATMPYSQLAPAKNQAPTGRVNDVFWEQFLTERPGSSDTEEASSSFRVNPCDEQEERKSGLGKSWRSKKDMEQLTL